MTRAFQNTDEEFVSRGTIRQVYIVVKVWIYEASKKIAGKIRRNK